MLLGRSALALALAVVVCPRRLCRGPPPQPPPTGSRCLISYIAVGVKKGRGRDCERRRHEGTELQRPHARVESTLLIPSLSFPPSPPSTSCWLFR